MSNAIQITNAIEAALIQGDLSKLTPEQRVSYYKSVCESVGLNPLTKPFEYITLNNKLTLYAKRDATDQLRTLKGVSITIPSREVLGEVYVVTARAKDKDGREDESTGAVCITGLKGESLANAYMKAETKAKRRVTLSVCGLGLLDESEVESIPGAKGEPIQTNAEVVQPENKQATIEHHLTPDEIGAEEDPGAFVITFGKYRGKRLDAIGAHDLDSWVKFMKDQPELSGKAQEAVTAADLFLKTREFDRNRK